MSEKHFVVSLHKGVDKDQFLNELNSNTSLENIPDRKVDNVNTRPISKRMLEVAISQEEADELLKDLEASKIKNNAQEEMSAEEYSNLLNYYNQSYIYRRSGNRIPRNYLFNQRPPKKKT